ncbi:MULTISPECIES: general stress protein CsbD [Roseivirga]|jgi:hypothetical protein|uniref:General stress protein CsbD n=1 Tax=Roseivirga thermotolerans TaxID=1758176 RepID=A0ABQ3IEA0_9BACT|nr:MULTISPECIES: general stress protein CsbD [Roseivirga]MEC7754560.1 general stress protein CsbD [Bacteroidota bacterium]GHE74948.1 hypothetical protein GCM10011340_34690 [Roseivirga thermotolerans]
MKRFLESNWSQIAPRLRSRYGQLSERDLHWEDGEENELLRRLERKLDCDRQELFREMKALITKK